MNTDNRQESFRVSAVLPVAFEVLNSDASGAPPFLTLGRRLSQNARDVVEKLSSRADAEFKEAITLTLDAMEALERQVDMLQRRVLLNAKDLELVDTEMELGADGVWIAEDMQHEGRVRLHLLLSARNAHHLLVMDASAGPKDGGTEYRWEPTDPQNRDLIVAFAFEHQRRERRRELDAPIAE
ncbi:MAG: hypothetical protein VX519_10260 [Myxococcota bacterium]|nr:hypothetical protein [Myxococcota bacterium]